MSETLSRIADLPATEPPAPRKPGQLRWGRMALGWLLGAASCAALAWLCAAVDTTAANVFEFHVPPLLCVPAMLLGMGGVTFWCVRMGWKSLAVGVVVFSAMALVGSVGLVVWVLAHWRC